MMKSPLRPPLTILEEFLLLAHDDAASQFYPLARSTMDCATAGATLMDLTLRHRIDNDLKHMFVVDAEPVDDDLLDPVLQVMALAPVMEPRSIAHWLHQVAGEGEALRERAMRRLEMRGILKREEKKILWVFSAERYPILHEGDVQQIKQRMRRVILGDDIPLPHDMMLTALAQACGLFDHILGGRELDAAQPRIDLVARMDLIGQAVAKAVTEVGTTMAMASGFR
ncbi:MAG: GPP34 family phosphoprotein [Alphaproteobacteria bacterium]|nr:GPP34 family phosphoprotein [Alphaproteobacteria bacterium]